MSDFGSDPQLPPPPVAPGAPPPPPAYAPPPGYAGYPVAMQKPPRPAVPVAGYLCLAAGALLILGSVLNWFSFDGVDYNGFSTVEGSSKDGPAFAFFAVLAIGAGITFLAARRVLALAIVVLVFEVFAMFAAFADISDVSDLEDLSGAFGYEFSTGPGLYIVLIGSLLGIAGNIVAISKRRR